MDMTFLEILISFFTVFMTGWILGQTYLLFRIRQNIEQIAKKYGMTLEDWAQSFDEVSKEKLIEVQKFFTEKTGNSILLYNKNTGRFVCQATSLEELADNFYQYNKIKLAMVEYQDSEVFFVEGKLKRSLE